MRVLVLYNEPREPASAAERDVLSQVQAVQQALDAMGCQTSRLGCTLDLQTLRQSLHAAAPDVVFNLVEGLGGTDRLMPLATLLLDAMQLPYTGAATGCLMQTSNKLAAKRLLRAAGLPTPDWIAAATGSGDRADPAEPTWPPVADRWLIIKPVFEHASCGIDDASVQPADLHIGRRLDVVNDRTGRPHFAERFVAGREFNLSLLAPPLDRPAGADQPPQVLPPAEIDFSAFGPDKPRIVGHAAKWDAQSFEYQQTPRRFDFPDTDRPLLDQLSGLAIDCWQRFGVRGYARVDLRVDADGQPWILEVNANPCLSPDAGFAAALMQARIPFAQAIRRIVADANHGPAVRRPAAPVGGAIDV